MKNYKIGENKLSVDIVEEIISNDIVISLSSSSKKKGKKLEQLFIKKNKIR